MEITRIETFLVRPDSRNYVFVRVHTDEGVYGVGEAYSAGPDDAALFAHMTLLLHGTWEDRKAALRGLAAAGRR